MWQGLLALNVHPQSLSSGPFSPPPHLQLSQAEEECASPAPTDERLGSLSIRDKGLQAGGRNPGMSL